MQTTKLILPKMGFSGFSFLKGVGGSSVWMSPNTLLERIKLKALGILLFWPYLENACRSLDGYNQYKSCFETGMSTLRITLLWFFLLRCNFLCRQTADSFVVLELPNHVNPFHKSVDLNRSQPALFCASVAWVWHMDHDMSLPLSQDSGNPVS